MALINAPYFKTENILYFIKRTIMKYSLISDLVNNHATISTQKTIHYQLKVGIYLYLNKNMPT